MTSRRRDTYEVTQKFKRALAEAFEEFIRSLPKDIVAGPESNLVRGYNACLQLVKCEEGHIRFAIPRELSRDFLIEALRKEFGDLSLDKKRDFRPGILEMDDTTLGLPPNLRCYTISLDYFPEVQPAATRGGR